MKKLDDQVFVSPQIAPDAVQGLADDGFQAIICNRPDDEDPGQPSFAEIEAAATAAGMSAHFVPATDRDSVAEAAPAFAKVMAETEGKVFAYCRSGTRCEMIWGLARGL